jgi:amino acid transporter
MSSNNPSKRSFFRAFVMVAWSFFGIRKGAEHQKDLEAVTPLQIVVVGVVSGLLFVMLLATVVSWIVPN